MFTKQFIGKTTWYTLIGIVAVHVLAVLVKDTSLALPALIVIAAATLWISWKSLPNGLLIAFAEIFIGGHGHLISASIGDFPLSLRMVVFLSVMLVWFIRYVKKDVKLSFVAFRDAPWLMIVLAIILGTLVGYFTNDFGEMFDDMNGYATIAYLLPIISIEWTQKRRRELLQVLFGSAVWLAFFTLLLSFLFTHLDGKTLNHVYRFVRDQRLAEITLQTSDSLPFYYYRVFMQSHFYSLIALLLMFSGILTLWRNQRLPLKVAGVFAVLGSVLLLSMSRSFFLGGVIAFGVIWILSFWIGKKPIVNIVKRSLWSLILGGLALAIAVVTIVFPFPPQPDISDAAFYETSSETGRDVALSSRWELIGPMMDRVWESPIIGSGFGANVTYESDDPRIRAIYEDGLYTTYRFEWGYQDIWLKMGIFGLVAFAWYAAATVQGLWFTANRHGHKWIILGLGGGLAMLFVAHIFSPYLNHPIGLGFMLFLIPFIDYESLVKRLQGEKARKKKISIAPQMSPAMRVKDEA